MSRAADLPSHEEHGNPAGLPARYVGTLPDALRIVALWESKQAAERFFAQMPEASMARLASATNGVPTVSAFSAQRAYSAV